MNQPPHPATAPQNDAPLQDFSRCHGEILTRLQTFGTLPALLAPAQRAREIASETLAFFRRAVFEHHAEEERELFPAVLASSRKGTERDHVQVYVAQLSAEHRVIEAAWSQLEPELKKVARGQSSNINPAAVEHLMRSYHTHVAFEEVHFLPLAAEILGRDNNHMAALGLSLHMRHMPIIVGHI